jgi:hypothetical protein
LWYVTERLSSSALARLAKLFHCCNALHHLRHGAQFTGRCVVKVKNPSLAAIDKFFRADERAHVPRSLRLFLQEFLSLLRTEDVVAVVNRLRADDEFRLSTQRLRSLLDHQMPVGDAAGVEQIRSE